MLGTNLENIKSLKIKGKNILKDEVEYCTSIPSEKRIYYLNHYISQDGEGQPFEKEETIEEHYDEKYGY